MIRERRKKRRGMQRAREGTETWKNEKQKKERGKRETEKKTKKR